MHARVASAAHRPAALLTRRVRTCNTSCLQAIHWRTIKHSKGSNPARGDAGDTAVPYLLSMMNTSGAGARRCACCAARRSSS